MKQWPDFWTLIPFSIIRFLLAGLGRLTGFIWWSSPMSQEIINNAHFLKFDYLVYIKCIHTHTVCSFIIRTSIIYIRI